MEQEKNYKPQIFPKFIIAIFLFILGIWIGRNIAIPFFPEVGQPKYQVLNRLQTKDSVDFATFWQAWDKLNEAYLDKSKLSGDKLMQGAIDGMVKAAGDPYTSYFNPEANKSFNSELSGSFEGVGMELGVRDGNLVVIAPLDESPAAKAGILAGDRVVEIDGLDATRYSIGDAVSKIRGKAGTKIKIGVVRGEDKQLKEFDITRDTITVKSVKTTIVGDTAVVELTRFGDNTQKDWDSAINEITTKGIKKLVLDMRNNPGGRLDIAINIAGDFTKKTTAVVLQEDSDGNRKSFYPSTDGRLQDVEVVVLINKGSASASEIVAGALQDLKIAKLVGETSFGKGTVQAVSDLKDGSSLHITVAKWLTPNGNWVHSKGLKTDQEVKRTEDDINSDRDPQLDKAKELLR